MNQINHLCVMVWKTDSKNALRHILTQRGQNLGMAESRPELIVSLTVLAS